MRADNVQDVRFVKLVKHRGPGSAWIVLKPSKGITITLAQIIPYVMLAVRKSKVAGAVAHFKYPFEAKLRHPNAPPEQNGA